MNFKTAALPGLKYESESSRRSSLCFFRSQFSREDRIRTCDHKTPSLVRYRAALLPDYYKILLSCKYRFIPLFLILLSKTTASLLDTHSITFISIHGTP